MLIESSYRNAKSLQLENDLLHVVILPGLGGKIASVYSKKKDFELLFQNPQGDYGRPGIHDSFGRFDASGFDDAFPSIDQGTVQTCGREVPYPDHGEIWSAIFQYTLEGEKARLQYNSVILPYHYEKTAELDCNALLIRYSITNTGDAAFPCLWAMHCLIHCEEDMQLIFPAGTKEMENVQPSALLGEPGVIHPYPETVTLNGDGYRLDRICPQSAKKSEKYYVRGRVNEGVCGAYYPGKDVRFTTTFDKNVLPYLGFWVTEGRFRGDYNCAMEPANGYYDSIAKAQENNALLTLLPGETLAFPVRMELE